MTFDEHDRCSFWQSLKNSEGGVTCKYLLVKYSSGKPGFLLNAILLKGHSNPWDRGGIVAEWLGHRT